MRSSFQTGGIKKKKKIKKLKLKLDKGFVEFSQFSHFSQDTRVSDCVPRWVEHVTARNTNLSSQLKRNRA